MHTVWIPTLEHGNEATRQNQSLKGVNRKMKMPYYSPKNKESGFTLVELLIAMTIGLIILAALSSTFLMQRKTYDIQEQIVEMVQTARAAMDMMTREIRMAGYDPTGTGGKGFINNADDRYDTDANSIHFTTDIGDGIDNDGDGRVDESDETFCDGDTNDTNEDINYYLYTANGIQKIGRRTGGAGSPQPIAENITGLSFSYRFADGGTGIPDETDGDNTNDLDDIRSVQFSITVRSAKPDPNINGGYRTHTLTSFITPRNLGL